MASVNWQKLHGAQDTQRILGHSLRWNGKEGVNYKNSDINPELTKFNYNVGVFKKHTHSWSEYQSLKSRVEELDKLHPPKRVRKDRVTAISMVVFAPDGLSESQKRKFFDMANDEINKLAGGSGNTSVGAVHVDERHEYIDPETKRRVMSRDHMHKVVIPWTKEHGVNAKHFETRENLNLLNNRIEERCLDMFHVHFMTGEFSGISHSVESLKRASRVSEIHEAEEQLLGTQIQAYNVSADIDNLNREKTRLQGDFERLGRLEKFVDGFQYHDRTLLEEFNRREKKRTHGRDDDFIPR